MRVTTAFDRLLDLSGTSVTDVAFAGDGVIVSVALRRRRAACSSCGQVCHQVHDRSIRRWRHLDMGGVFHRVRAAPCALPRLRRAGRSGPVRSSWRTTYTRLQDVVAFLAHQMAKTPIAKLMRIAWSTVGAIVERVVADHPDEGRLAGLVQIGVDEISYRKGQRYLTCVADHAGGGIVWSAPGRSAATLVGFFDPPGRTQVFDSRSLGQYVGRL